MKSKSHLFTFFLLSLTIKYSQGACSNLRIDAGTLYVICHTIRMKMSLLFQDWGNGFSGDLDVTSDHDASGFTLVITFDQPLTSFEQWTGDASSSDQK